MKKNYNITKTFLAFLLLYQALFINACSIFNLPNSSTSNIKANTFTKKSVPDPVLCSTPENLGITVSTPKLYTKSLVTITTNIPAKFDQILTLNKTALKYKVKIEKTNSTRFFEKEIPSGCTSFDWDGTDSNGVRLEAGQYKIGLYISYDVYYNYNYFAGNFYYDFKTFYEHASKEIAYCNESMVKIAGNNSENTYNTYCDKGTAREIFTPDEFSKQNDNTSIELLDIDVEPTPLDPATTKFFEVEDFQKLSDYVNQLNIDDSQANELYNQAVLLDKYEKEKSSLLARGKVDTTKLDAINRKIQSANDSITSLQGSVMVQLSDLYNKAYTLASHVNTITEAQYIVPYPPEEKPESAYSYSEEAYSKNKSINTYLLDSIKLFEPDPNNPDQEDLSLTSDLEHSRAESLDPENIFDATKSIFEEIQTAKDLSSDLTSNTILSEEKSLALETLGTLLTQLKNHSGLLKTKSKDFNTQYTQMAEKVVELHKYTQSQLTIISGSILENLDSYDDNTYRLKSVPNNQSDVTLGKDINKLEAFNNNYNDFLEKAGKVLSKIDNNKFGTKSFKNVEYINKIRNYIKNIASDFYDGVTTYEQIIASFDGSNISNTEKSLAVILAIDKNQWDKIKTEQPVLINELIASYKGLLDKLKAILPNGEQVDIDKIIKEIENSRRGVLNSTTKISIAKGKPQTPKSGKLLKVIGALSKIYDAWDLLDNLYDFYKKAVPVKKVANKICYGFDTSTDVGTKDKPIRCLNELGEYLINISDNTTLKNRYPLYRISEIMNKNSTNKVVGSTNAQELQNSIYNPKVFRKKLREITYKQTSTYLKEDIVAPSSISDPNWAWKNKIYNGYYDAYARLVIGGGIGINKINLKNREPVLYSPKIKDRTGDGLITGNTGFIVKLVDINGDTLLVGDNDWNKNSGDFHEATRKFLLDVIVPYVDNYNASNPVIIQNKPTLNDLKTYLSKAFTWHHDEEFLDEMILVPKFIHRRISHWGAAFVIKKSKNNKKWRNQWKNVLIYN